MRKALIQTRPESVLSYVPNVVFELDSKVSLFGALVNLIKITNT